MTTDPLVLLISGSTRAASTNTAMLRTLAAQAPHGATELYADLPSLPAFNTDHDHDPLPAPVVGLRAAIGRADAMLFCTPEYAGALPGAFKNLLDWTVGDPGRRSVNGKPVGWLNVSGPLAPSGGADAHESLTKVMGYLGAAVVEDACRRIPLTRASVDPDGLVREPDARSAALAALGVLRAVVAAG